jgi:hypothetical protein
MIAPAARNTATQAASMAAVDRRIVLGRQIGGIDHVLDPDRDPVQRADRAVAREVSIPLARLGKRARRIERGPSTHNRFALVDPGKTVADQAFGGDFARGDRLRCGGRRQKIGLQSAVSCKGRQG